MTTTYKNMNKDVRFATCALQGGIGNKFFQMAACFGFAKQNNANPILPFFEFKDIYNIPETFFTLYDVIISNNNKHVYNEPVFHYVPIAENFQAKGTIIQLVGYFQSAKYFDNVKEQVKEWLQPKIQLQTGIDDQYWKIAGNTSSIMVSVHYRAADYRQFPQHHPIMPPEYYINCIKLLKIKYPNNTIKILWFSDEMGAVKRMINETELRQLVDGKLSYHFIENGRAYEDLYLMSKCDVCITANSSFSWWGAYLSNAELVLCPDRFQWFGNALKQHNTKDLYLDNWVEIRW